MLGEFCETLPDEMVTNWSMVPTLHRLLTLFGDRERDFQAGIGLLSADYESLSSLLQPFCQFSGKKSHYSLGFKVYLTRYARFFIILKQISVQTNICLEISISNNLLLPNSVYFGIGNALPSVKSETKM